MPQRQNARSWAWSLSCLLYTSTLDAFEVTDITVEPIDEDPNIGRVIEGKAIVQGTLEKEISFLDREFESQEITEKVPFSVLAVSYTHLDVYKRQCLGTTTLRPIFRLGKPSVFASW